MYDDTPFYIKNAQPKSEGQSIHTSHRHGTSVKSDCSETKPSHLQLWYEQENRKRRAGLKNEIDINEIRAAAKGVRNKWTDRVAKHPKVFQPVIEGTYYDWQEIMALESKDVAPTWKKEG